MRQYSSDKVEIAWLGLDFSEGLATGTFIAETRETPTFTKKTTARGKAIRTFNPNRSGSLTITVDQESKLHQQLLAIAEDDRDPNQRDKVDTMRMSQPGVSATRYVNAYITTEPDEARGTESATFGWVFEFEEKIPEPVAEPANLVGN
jgi:hypothetical protein